MRLVENETRRTMNTRRNFVNYATMTLSDGTVLNLTPSDFRISGNSFTDDWCDGEEFQLGSAIGKTATLLLDNTDGRTEIVGSSTITYRHGKFSEYDFYMAYFVLYVCLPEAYTYEGTLTDQMIRIGTFTVTTPTAHGSTIEITGVDNMYMFDKSFDDCDLDFDASPTLLTILNKCCEDCGVVIGYGGFNNQNLTVNKKPEGVTYRQIVSYVAQIAGCNAKINETGALTLIWYDMSVFTDNWLDGGTFTAIGKEFLYYTYTCDGTMETQGRNIQYDSSHITRSGRYKITRINISNISDPDNFDADYRLCAYISLNYNPNRFNRTVVLQDTLVEGDNIINYEIDISTLNRTVYWVGIVDNNYGDPNAATFDYTIYFEPVSYDDLNSADGGTFETEFQYYSATNWIYSGETTSSYWYFYKTINFNLLKPAGKYTITRAYIDNIADPLHFNADYIVQKTIDSGATWTDEQTGTLVPGDNIINLNVEIPENTQTQYRMAYRQDVVADPDASEFDATLYMKANDLLYLDGDSFDGGDFATPLEYHNLTAVNGTSVSTDDIQFTGVLVSYDDVSVHYPSVDGWDYYAMEVTENPFVVGNESAIATYLYNELSHLKFRPFTTSSIQDPTIEAGDCALVYDIKGNTYFSVVTNVTFKTGGMTEVSCNAEPPLKQNSRYVNPAAQAVAKAEKKMDDYNAQVAHFNELASDALGYYKTEEVDPLTSATITYIHDSATLATSTIIWKITGDGIFISEDGGESYNAGYDASTGTMLMNLIYAHGITADWIRTGTLTLGGVNNEDGVLSVLNASNTEIGKWDNTGIKVKSGTITLGNKTSLTDANTGAYLGLDGLALGASSVFKVTSTGVLSATSGEIGGFAITSNALGNKIGSSQCVGMISGDKLFTWSSGGQVDITFGQIYIGTGSSTNGLRVYASTGYNGTYIQYGYSDVYRSSDGKNVSWTSSDRRLKKNIKDLTLEKSKELIDNVRPREFRFKNEDIEHGIRYGFIAQELRENLEEENGIEYETTQGTHAIHYDDFIAPLCMLVKDQQRQIDELKAEVNALKEVVNNLK